MTLFRVSMAMTVVANLVYHLCQKSIPKDANPIASLVATYATALVISLAGFPLFFPAASLPGAMRGLTWVSYALGGGIVLFETGFLLAYRAGWNLSQCALYSNVMLTLILLPIGLVFFREQLSRVNLVGMALALLGLVLMARD